MTEKTICLPKARHRVFLSTERACRNRSTGPHACFRSITDCVEWVLQAYKADMIELDSDFVFGTNKNKVKAMHNFEEKFVIILLAANFSVANIGIRVYI